MEEQDNVKELAYRQKLAHNAWLKSATARGFPPSPEASELVWNLMVAYGETLPSFNEAREDIYKTAYELATLLLPEMPMKRIWGIYRDLVVQAVMQSTYNGSAAECENLLAFANTLSAAYAEAQADTLKKQSLRERAVNITRELKLAKRIQTHLLPKQLPVIPGYEFAGRLIPAEEVGGDYWSVKYKEEDGIVTLKLADITGHGVAAATLVAAVKFISGGYYPASKSAAEVMKKTNRVLTIETPHDIAVTMIYGWLRPASRELALVNAGHSPVFICSQNECIDVPITGPVLGVMETADYTETNYTLSKGDIVFFGSDGITEAGTVNPFGLGRLKDIVVQSAHLSADQIADNVVQAVNDYARNPHDDISMLVIKVTQDAADAA